MTHRGPFQPLLFCDSVTQKPSGKHPHERTLSFMCFRSERLRRRAQNPAPGASPPAAAPPAQAAQRVPARSALLPAQQCHPFAPLPRRCQGGLALI